MTASGLSPKQIFIIAENAAIRRPLVEALSLSPTRELPGLRAWGGRSSVLVESRGSSTAGAIVGHLLGRYGFGATTRLFHVGRSLACGAEGAALLGRLVVVNRVEEAMGGRAYYPDILLSHRLPEAGVRSLPAATGTQATGRRSAAELRDEQLAGVAAAASLFLGPHQLFCLAAVVGLFGENDRSREGTPSRWREIAGGEGSARGEGEIVAREARAIVELLEASAGVVGSVDRAPSGELRRLLDRIAESMRLTASQRSELDRMADGATARGRDPVALLAGYGGAPQPRTKQERNRQFEGLRHVFEG